jgi:hypothetical protein
MKHAFNVEYSNDHIPNNLELCYSLGKVTEDLQNIILSNIDSDLIVFEHKDILRDWFPESNCHIFLSHSHKDKNLAIYIANALFNKYKIKTFIDSEFWGYVDKAISNINHKYNTIQPENEYLHYDKCMRVASNFYLILSNALTDGIDASDSIWFLNSKNSLNAISDDNQFSTYSPWIYTELNFSSKVQRRGHQNRSSPMFESVKGTDSYHEITKQANVSVRYDAPNEHLIDVSDSDMHYLLTNGIALEHSYQNDKAFDYLDKIYSFINTRNNN